MISLDFELSWGIHDVFALEKNEGNMYGARIAIPRILQLFLQYDIHATWAVVGMLHCTNKEELMKRLEKVNITYDNPSLSPFVHLTSLGESEMTDPAHYAPSLIQTIKETPNQEIGSHTFTHYYCLEAGQRIDQFERDLQEIVQNNENVTSLVFPRNHTNYHYLKKSKQYGFTAFRGHEDSWIYKPDATKTNTQVKQMLRYVDQYINLTGHHTYSLKKIQKGPILNIRSSHFLKPYSKQIKMFERLRLRRIKNGLTKAAKANEIYHLWWQPHHFGKDMEENLHFLKEILKHVDYLKKHYHFQSLNMRDVTDVMKILS